MLAKVTRSTNMSLAECTASVRRAWELKRCPPKYFARERVKFARRLRIVMLRAEDVSEEVIVVEQCCCEGGFLEGPCARVVVVRGVLEEVIIAECAFEGNLNVDEKVC